MLSARYVTHVLLVICLSTIVNLAQAQAAPSNTSKPEDQVAQLERDWLAADAKGDAARLRQIIFQDYPVDSGCSSVTYLLSKNSEVCRAND